MNSRAGAALVGGGAAVALGAAPAHASPTFVAPAAPSGLAAEGNLPTAVAVTGDGATFAFAAKGVGGLPHLVVSVRPPAGTFGAAVDLTPDAPGLGAVFGDSVTPLAGPDGRVTVAYARYSTTVGGRVLQVRTRDAGGTWSAPDAPAGSVALSSDPKAVIDASGAVTVVWVEGSTVKASRRAASATTWSAPAIVGTNLWAGVAVAAAPGGRLMVAYGVMAPYPSLDLRTATSTNGTDWAPGPTIGGMSEFVRPSLALADSGEALLGWLDRVSVPVVKAARLAAETDAQWTPPTRLTSFSSNRAAYKVEVALTGGGQATVVWNSTSERTTPGSQPGGTAIFGADAGPGEAFAAYDSGTPNRDRISGAQDFGEHSSPDLETGPAGDQVVVYSSGNGTDIHAVQRAGAGTSWGPPVTLDTSTGRYLPTVDLADGSGEGAVIWQSDADPSPNRFAEVAGIDVWGPSFDLGDQTAVAGEAKALELSALDTWSPVDQVSWTFGDGGTATGARVTHTWAQPGTYEVTVTATDAFGHATGPHSVTVVVAAAPVPVQPQPLPQTPTTTITTTVPTPPAQPTAPTQRELFKQVSAIVASFEGKGFGSSLGTGSLLTAPFTFTADLPAGRTTNELLLQTSSSRRGRAAAAKTTTVVLAKASKTVSRPTRDVRFALKVSKTGRKKLKAAKKPVLKLRVTYVAPGAKPVVRTTSLKTRR